MKADTPHLPSPEELREYPVSWIWHSLLPIALILGTCAWLRDHSAVIHWLVGAEGITEKTDSYSVIIGFGLFGLSGLCVLLWFLRRPLTKDWQYALQCWHHSPTNVHVSDVVLFLHSRFNLTYSIGLGVWFAVCLIALHQRASWLIPLTKESGLLESVTVLSFLGAGVLGLMAVVSDFRQKRHGLHRWVVLLLALACLLVGFEEMNWGQAYLRFNTPGVFAEVNTQNDLSLHNVKILGVSGWANRVHWMLTVVLGFVIPIVLWLVKPIRRLAYAWQLPVLPWVAQLTFLVGALMPKDAQFTGDFGAKGNVPSELREFIVAIGILVWFWAVWRNQRSPQSRKPAAFVPES